MSIGVACGAMSKMHVQTSKAYNPTDAAVLLERGVTLKTLGQLNLGVRNVSGCVVVQRTD